jgi:hypothetical protein
MPKTWSRRFIASLAGALALAGPAAVQAETAYVFATFKGDAAADEKLWIYTSTNATAFSELSQTFYGGPTGVLRDPSIMKHTDGKYYVAYTVQSWTTQSTTFAIASSTDLVNWQTVATVPAGVAGTAYTWAPEWFVENGTVRLIVSLGTASYEFKPYVLTATDGTLTHWSAAADMNLGTNRIHAFVKNETTKYVEHATATSLLGPWTWVGTGDWAGWGSGYEAPALVQVDNGQWRLYVDQYPSGGIWSATSSDLVNWTGLTSIGPYRHGTVIKDTNYTAGHPPAVQYVANRNSAKVLDVQNPNQSAGANVGQYTLNRGPWQQWQFFDRGNGWFNVVSVNSGMCLDVSGAATADNADIVQWTCNGGTNQQWQWAAHGSYHLLKARHSGKCADVSGSAVTDGADVRQQACTGAANQDWSLQP